MKIRKRLWNLHCGNKAVVFALDALIAVVMVFALLATATSFLIKGEEDVSANLQLSRTANDIITLLDNTQELDSLDETTIENAMNSLIPDNYNMSLNISWQDVDVGISGPETGDIIIGNPIPDSGFVATGKRFFLAINETYEPYISHYGVVGYAIWLE